MSTDTSPEKSSIAAFTTATKIVAALGLTGGVLIHFIGYMHHIVYLEAWGVSPQLFPKSIEWLGARGYLTTFTQISGLLSFLSENWIQLASLSFAIFISMVIPALFERNEKRLEGFVGRFPRVKGFLIACLSMIGLIAVLILIALVLARTLIAIPGAIGVTSGQEAAAKDLARFRKGCEQEIGCTSVLKEGSLVARGFLIDSSPTHLALYIPTDKLVRIIPIEGLELSRSGPSVETKAR
jgi:hypothetical protein